MSNVVPVQLKIGNMSLNFTADVFLSFVHNFQSICDALRDLVPLVQFKEREKHPWRSVNFSKVAG